MFTKCLLQSATSQKGLDGGFLAPEVGVHFHFFHRSALLQDILPESQGSGGIEKTGFPECVEGILVQYLGPDIGIVSGGIASCKDVGEVGGAAASQLLDPGIIPSEMMVKTKKHKAINNTDEIFSLNEAPEDMKE